MLTLALGAAMQAAPVPPAPAEPAPGEQEIVVLGRWLAKMYVDVGRDAKGRYSCALNRTSGNRFLDGELCRVAVDCVRKGANDPITARACVDKRKPALLASVRQSLKRRRGW